MRMDKADSKLGLAISLIAGAAALVVMLTLPLTYFSLGYQEEATAAQTKADLYAALVNDPAKEQGAKHPTKQARLARLIEMLEADPLGGEQETHRIFDTENNLVAETLGKLGEPLVTRTAELKNSVAPFARIEITRSLHPLLINTALVGVLGALLGSAIFFALRIFPMRALHLAVNEINERRRTESDLQQSLSILAATLESTADGILVVDRLGRIASFNDRFIEMWQIPDYIVASRDNNLILGAITRQLSDPQWFLEKFRQLRENPPKSSDAGPEVIDLTDGPAFELTSKPQWIAEQNAGWVWSFHDITERKRAEALLSGEKQVLEQIVSGASLPEVLEILVHGIEAQSGRMFCTILLSDDQGRLQHAGAYGISKDFLSAAKRLVIPPTADTFARTGTTGEAHASLDMSSEPVWADYRDLALRHGLQARWAAPIHSTTGSVLGLVATYYREHDNPDPHDLRLIEIACNLTRIVIERKHAEARMEFLAHYDSLTGLPNRTLFRDRLAHAIARADRDNQMLALMFIDLDRFKTINDTLGHHIGDLMLKGVAERIKTCVREEDTAARLGGDEFTVILEQITAPEDASGVAQKIIDELSPPFNLLGNEAFITASIGISIYPTDNTDMDGLLKNTDAAMYNAKETGRNNFQFYAKEMNVKALGRLELENSLRHAVERGEFVLYYQPKISLDTGKTAGMEALLRWVHPRRGIVSPIEFIPLLEETGLINQVGDWLIHTACIQNKIWMDAGFPPMRVAVNLSARQFQHNDLLQHVTRALDDSGLDGDFLELEVTESLLMQNPEYILDVFHEMGALGVVRIDIDDFGTGYSSLSNLKRFPITTVKIDQSFIQGIPHDEEDVAIVTTVIGMAKSLKLKVIAEGVENEAQLALLCELGCDEVQGYVFSRPLPAEGFAKWLRRGDLKDRIVAACKGNKVMRP
jgi:diguanylate cyclase (GGDEF)-like protein